MKIKHRIKSSIFSQKRGKGIGMAETTLKLNTIVHSDCIEYMKSLPDSCIDLVVTSPPYAEQRSKTYGGINEKDYPEWMQCVGREIYRVLKPTGSFVLNIKENVNNGTRSTYVLKTVLLLSEIFNWSDTFIWNKTNPFPTGSQKRLKDGFEYCYFFTKTKQYKFYPNNVLVKSQSKWLESEKRRSNKGSHNVTNGSGMNMGRRYATEMVRPSNVLSLAIDSTNHKHPATFPITLPSFFIKLLTDKDDVVYDPFSGSGTTLLAAKQLERNYIGTELMEEYVSIINDRMAIDK